MESPHSCPDANVLRKLLDGGLSEGEESELGTHLENCTGCQAALEELAAKQEAWAGARYLNQTDLTPETALRRVLDKAKGEPALLETLAAAETNVEPLDLSFLEPAQAPGYLGRIEHYDVIEILGRGGMGVVLKAFDRALRRTVAIKLLAPHLAASPTARQRFIREARAAAAISDKHVVTVHAVQEVQGHPYLVMQYVAGVSLQQRLDDAGALEVNEILRIGAQIASGLAAAHALGLIHRDIKPANILLEQGPERVKITDFGLARAVDDVSLTRTGEIAGTAAYMAPEQARGDLIDVRADLFSLGSVLYAMCAGRPPFSASVNFAVIRQVCREQPQPIREINPQIPEWLAAIIEKLHAKAPADRFQTAAEVAELLNRYIAHLENPELAPVPPVPGDGQSATPAAAKRLRSSVRDRRAWLLGAVVLIALGTMLAAMKFGPPDSQLANRSAEPMARGENGSQHGIALSTVGDDRNETPADQSDASQQLAPAPAPGMTLGETLYRRGDWAGALAALEQELQEKQGDETPAWFLLAMANSKQGRQELARRYFELALDLKEAFRASWENDAEKAGRLYSHRAEAAQVLGLEDPGPDSDYALADRRDGETQQKQGNNEKANELFARAFAAYEKLAARFPNVSAYRRELARLHQLSGRDAEAEKLCREGVIIAGDVIRGLPKEPDPRRAWGALRMHWARFFWSERGDGLKAGGQFDAAERAFRQAIELGDRLVADFPGVPDYRFELAHSHVGLAHALWAKKTPESAEQEFRQGAALFQKLVDDFPNVPTYSVSLSDCYRDLGKFYAAENQPQKAAEERANFFRVSLQTAGVAPEHWKRVAEHIAEDLVDRAPPNVEGTSSAADELIAICNDVASKSAPAAQFRRKLVQSLIDAGWEMWRSRGYPGGAEKWERYFRVPLDQAAKLRHDPGTTAEDQHLVAGAHFAVANTLHHSRRSEEAEQQYREAIATLSPLGRENAAARKSMGVYHYNLAEVVNWQPGRAQEAQDKWRRAVEYLESVEATSPQADGNKFLIRSHLSLAALLTLDGRTEEAQTHLDRAVELRPTEARLATPWAGNFAGPSTTPESIRIAREGYKTMIAMFDRLVVEFPEEMKYRLAARDARRAYAEALWRMPGQGGEERIQIDREVIAANERDLRDFPNHPTLESNQPHDWRYLGYALMAATDMAGAREAFLESVRHSSALSERDPQAKGFWLHCTAGTHHQIGLTLEAAGQSEQAQASFLAALELEKQVLQEKLDVGNWGIANVFRVLSTALSKVGRPEDVDELRAVPRPPVESDANFSLEIARCYTSLGDRLAATQRTDESLRGGAEKAYREAFAITREIVGLFPNNASYWGQLVTSQTRLCGALLANGHPQEADQVIQESLESLVQLAEATPPASICRRELGRLYNHIGITQMRAGRFGEAEQAHRQALLIYDRLIRQHASPADARWARQELAWTHLNLGNTLKSGARPAAAVEAFHQSLELSDKLGAEFPDYGMYQDWIARNSYELAVLHSSLGDSERAAAAFQQLVQASPTSAYSCNNIAWLLATCPEPKFRNAARSVELANKAVELAPQEGSNWNTLGAAYYRAGDWRETITAIEKSMELRKGGDSFDWYFLAMAHFQAGRKEEARQWYDRAVEWTAKNNPTDDELRRFEAEAAELLGPSRSRDAAPATPPAPNP